MFLCAYFRCLSKEPSTIQQLSRHSFILEKITDGVNININNNSKPLQPVGSNDPGHDQQGEPIPLLVGNGLLLGKSRLMHEFEIMQWLGKGGFGSVLKVYCSSDAGNESSFMQNFSKNILCSFCIDFKQNKIDFPVEYSFCFSLLFVCFCFLSLFFL